MASNIILILALIVRLIHARVAPSDCQYSGDNYLTCQLSSINSRLERTDFSVIPSQTRGLKIVCNQRTPGRRHQT